MEVLPIWGVLTCGRFTVKKSYDCSLTISYTGALFFAPFSSKIDNNIRPKWFLVFPVLRRGFNVD